MNIVLGDIIIDKLKDLPWVDKYAGVVKTIIYKDAGKEKKFPAACRTTLEQCESGRYADLCPNTTKKSVLYLEDGGIRFTGKRGSLYGFTATFNLVGWLNLPALGYDGCNYCTTAVIGILKAIPETPFNSGNFQRIEIKPIGEEPRNNNPFSKYSYDETVSQMLMWPYDYFMLRLEVSFFVNALCLVAPAIGTPSNCYPLPTTRFAKIVDQDGNVVKELKSNETYQVIIASGVDERGSTTTYSIKVIDNN